MEHYALEEGIFVLYIKASFFPTGIQEAHDRLHALVGTEGRMFFGISYSTRKGTIEYLAAAQEK